MAFVAGSVKQKSRRIGGPNGFTLVHWVAQFSTTDASGDIECLIPRVEGYSPPASIGPRAADEQIYLDELASFGDQLVKRPSDGMLTFTRTGASKTSAMRICGSYWGY